MSDINTYHFSFSDENIYGTDVTGTATMSNIRLEELEQVVMDIKTKRIFLYTNNPLEEPEYVTIQDILNTINSEFNLADTIEQMAYFIGRMDNNEAQVTKLNTDVTNIKNSLISLTTSNNSLTTNVAGLLTNVANLLSDVTTISQKTDANINNIVTLQTGLNDVQLQLQNISTLNNTNLSLYASYFNVMQWQKL